MGIIIPTLEGKMRLNYLKSNTFQNVLSDLSLYSKLLSNPVLKMLLPYLLRWQWILNLSWHYLILLTSLLHSRYITQVESQTKHMGNWTYCPVILPPPPRQLMFLLQHSQTHWPQYPANEKSEEYPWHFHSFIPIIR